MSDHAAALHDIPTSTTAPTAPRFAFAALFLLGFLLAILWYVILAWTAVRVGQYAWIAIVNLLS